MQIRTFPSTNLLHGASPSMEGQIENAINIAWDSQSDPTVKQQAFHFLSNLRSDPHGWQACAALFLRHPPPTEVVRVVCLEVINNAVVGNHDTTQLAALKDIFLGYVRRSYGANPEQVDSPTLQNKLTQTLAFLFVRLYKQGWETFLDDFLSITSLPGSDTRGNPAGCILYLRILLAIHDEIADQLLYRQPDEAKRNVDLKDLVRQRDMLKVVCSWRDMLARYQDSNDKIIEMTLKVLGKWVQWIDITLVIQQDVIKFLLPLVGRTIGDTDKVRDAAVDAYTEITSKKMKSADKMDLITFLQLRQIVSELVNSPPLNQYRGTPKYDTDLAEAVARLVNVVVTDVVKALESFSQHSAALRAEQHLLDFLPLLLRFFSDEFDEVCSFVIPCLTDVLTFFRKISPLPPRYGEMLPNILNAIIRKMRYDETASWGNEDEQTDEAEFQELRKRLQNLQKSVAAVDQNLYLEILSNLVASTFQTLDQQGHRMDWRDLDLALHEMYLFGELALPNQGLVGKSPPNTAAAERLLVIMTKMVESDISRFPHPAILLQYMEICVRYAVFFENRHEYIPHLLENFVRLVHHNHIRVRLRSWYLFFRLVRQLRSQVQGMAETVIQSISDLLTIKAELPGDEADDDMSSDESDHSADAVFTNQCHLFEAIGCISSTGGTPVAKQVLYARSIMEPLFADVQQNLSRAKSGDSQAALQVHHIVTVLGILGHGFTGSPAGSNLSKHHRPAPAPAKEVSEVFSRAADVILVALKELNTNREIRTACRSAFSRLFGVLGATVLPQLPQWIEGLLCQSSSHDEMAMFLRLLEQIVFNFKAEIYEILNLLLSPLLQRIYEGLSQPACGTDDEIQLGELRREYLHFIQIILQHDLGGVLVSETNQGNFEVLMSSIVSLARNVSYGNLSTSRLAFGLMTKITAVWGGPDVATISRTPTAPTGSPAPPIPGFDGFVLQRFHTVCWEVLKDPHFNPSDAQSRQVMNEIVQVEQTIYTKTGDLFIRHVQSTLFPELGIDGREFLRCLSTDKKAFADYLTRFSGFDGNK